jgi:hypothetical protein
VVPVRVTGHAPITQALYAVKDVTSPSPGEALQDLLSLKKQPAGFRNLGEIFT